jgi:hypothetical protein
MILIPSLIDDALDRTEIVNAFAPATVGRKFGVVVLAPSFVRTIDWNKIGAQVADRATIDVVVRNLRIGAWDRVVVLVNRYDGIDLPDQSCRILIFDSLPQGENLSDKYVELTRPGSDLLNLRLARSIEQGLGRSVRGEKDYCVIIVVGPELVRFLRQPNTRGFLSEQTRKQVEIGHTISQMAEDEVKEGASAMQAFQRLINQCLKRDQDWKNYYVEQMNALMPAPAEAKGLDLFETELKAETLYCQRHSPDGAVKLLQDYLDDVALSDAERGYYLQEMARYLYESKRVESNRLQVSAHTKNRYLLLPRTGSEVAKLEPLPGARIANIMRWVRDFGSYDQLKIAIDDICQRLRFGVAAEEFERAVHELGSALGYSSERPDKEWKAGPDNLWCLVANDYMVMECKSEVTEGRAEIYKTETGQMNNAVGWFHNEYPGSRCTRLMFIPTYKLGQGAFFNDEVGIVRKTELGRLCRAVLGFFVEFKAHTFDSLEENAINAWLIAHKLTTEEIKSGYQHQTYAGQAHDGNRAVT